jgi:23S rRNA pseudouridine2457 synthase
LRLVRVSIGPLELGDLEPGTWRDLSPRELEALRALLRRQTGR